VWLYRRYSYIVELLKSVYRLNGYVQVDDAEFDARVKAVGEDVNNLVETVNKKLGMKQQSGI
jgi:hypothetical protein